MIHRNLNVNIHHQAYRKKNKSWLHLATRYNQSKAKRKWKWKSFSHVQLFAIPWTVCGILQARILEWLAFPFSRGSSPPRDWTQVSCIACGFFTSWATREAQSCRKLSLKSNIRRHEVEFYFHKINTTKIIIIMFMD